MKENRSSIGKQDKSSKSTIFTSNADLVAVVLSTLVLIALLFLPSGNISTFREILGLIFVIFNPGYALTAALFPRKHDLSNIERITLAFGLSISIVPLLVFVLGYTQAPEAGLVEAVIFCLIILSTAVAFLRRSYVSKSDRFTVQWTGLAPAFQLYINKQNALHRIFNILLIVSLVLSTSVVVYTVVMPYQSDRFTEFYLLNANGTADNYPLNFSLSKNNTPVKVGITNREGQDVTYDLVIQQNVSPRPVTIYSQQLTLGSNSQWEKTITLKPAATTNTTEFRFLLYKNGNTSVPYRETHLYANVTA